MGVWIIAAYQQDEIWFYGKTPRNEFRFKSGQKNAQTIGRINFVLPLPDVKMDSRAYQVIHERNENWKPYRDLRKSKIRAIMHRRWTNLQDKIFNERSHNYWTCHSVKLPSSLKKYLHSPRLNYPPSWNIRISITSEIIANSQHRALLQERPSIQSTQSRSQLKVLLWWTKQCQRRCLSKTLWGNAQGVIKRIRIHGWNCRT